MHLGGIQLSSLMGPPQPSHPNYQPAVIGLVATLAMHAGRPEPEEEKARSKLLAGAELLAPATVPRVPDVQRASMAIFTRVPQQAVDIFMPAMRAGTAEATQIAALQGLIKVAANKVAATAFLGSPALRALLAVSQMRGSKACLAGSVSSALAGPS